MLVVAGLGISLLLGEIAFRVFDQHRPPNENPSCGYWDAEICALYQPYDPHGYRLWPSREKTYKYPRENPRLLSVVSNKNGFRSSREFDEPDDRKRILVVGDSFVFGEGVQENERFSNVLEIIRPDWRVDNLGMTG